MSARRRNHKLATASTCSHFADHSSARSRRVYGLIVDRYENQRPSCRRPNERRLSSSLRQNRSFCSRPMSAGLADGALGRIDPFAIPSPNDRCWRTPAHLRPLLCKAFRTPRGSHLLGGSIGPASARSSSSPLRRPGYDIDIEKVHVPSKASLLRSTQTHGARR